ncbi:hypothetical protein Zm00014a_006295 [Zea mays]|uniref:Uncharacterized protein n=1 Tax=Zea mays TaxID=4577 RepID=A0A3L6DRW9_MAIZE|nr:hypothetical protein Zm00014a_006295 [Zea mays]
MPLRKKGPRVPRRHAVANYWRSQFSTHLTLPIRLAPAKRLQAPKHEGTLKI